MYNLILKNTSLKLKIIYSKIIFVISILIYFVLQNILENEYNIFYTFFIIIGISLSLIFRKEKSIIYDKKKNKIVKKTELLTIALIISLVIFRLFIVELILKNIGILNIELGIYLISLGFFSGKLYFAIKKIIHLRGNIKTKT